MANKQITFQFRVTAVGNQTIATLATLLAAVPLDLAPCRMLGLMPTQVAALGGPGGDTTTTVGQAATRTIVLAMDIPATPTNVAATATATLGGVGGALPGSVAKLTLTNADISGDYAAPPVVGFTAAPQGPSVPSGLPIPGGTSPSATCSMALSQGIITNQGSGYTAPTAVLKNVQLTPTGVAPVLGTVVQAGGLITTVNIVNAGKGLLTYPDVVISDPTGSGATAVCGLAVDTLALNGAGSGYSVAPTVSFTPIFKRICPDTANQAGQLRGWMQKVLEKSLRCPILSIQPVVA